jgi:hypothetical protein
VAYTKADPLRPADLAVMRGGKSVQLTRLNEELFAGKIPRPRRAAGGARSRREGGARLAG